MIRRLTLAALRMAVGAGLVAAVAAPAHWPIGEPATEAALRLALRTVGTRVEACRERSAAELAALPAHMRAPRVCERYALAYRLQAAVDGKPVVDTQVEPAGVRHDRPVGLDVQVPLAPGVHELDVRFAPVPPPEAKDGYPVELQRALEHAHRYTLATTVAAAAGRIVLITLDRDADTLMLNR